MSLQEVYDPRAADPTPEDSGPSFDINEYLQLILSRWRLVALIVVVCLGLGLTHYFLTPKLYRAATTIQIEQRSLLSVGGEFNPWLEAWASRQYYPTQYRLLRSRGLAEMVVSTLKLAGDPRFNPSASTTASRTGGSESDLQSASAETIARLATRVQGGLAVNPVSQTELVELSFVSTDPQLAAQVVNGVADAFIDWGIQTRARSVGKTSDFLEQQIAALKGEIDERERRLQEYGRETDIVNLDPDSNVILERLRKLNEELTTAIGTRLQKESAYNSLRTSSAALVVESTESELVAGLRRELLELGREYEANLQVYKPDWPEMVELQSRIDERRLDLDRQIETEAEAIRRRAYSEYQTASRRERSLEQQIEQVKSEAMDASFAAVEYQNIEMEVSNRRSLLDELLKRLTEAGMSARLQSTRESNVRVIDRALIPGSPFRPSLRNDISIGLSTGLALGVALILLFHFLDRTLKGSEELERLLGIPVLAVIPDVSAGSSRYGSYSYYGGGKAYGANRATRQQDSARRDPAEKLEIELLPQTRPKLAVSEAYRSLRTGLLLSSAEELRVVIVTSAQASEGKTATAANLAVVMAQLGRKVLLVDADLRKPRVHKVFKCSNRTGLVHYLTGSQDLSSLIQPSGIENLSICPSGPHPPNPSELLASDRFSEFFALARQQFDFVVVDTPPVLAVTDSILAASKSNGVLLCFRANKILREEARTCADRLRLSDVRILGAVLNCYRPIRGGYYDRRYYYYYQSYAEDAENPEHASADSAA